MITTKKRQGIKELHVTVFLSRETFHLVSGSWKCLCIGLFFFSVAIGSFVLICFLHVANDSVSIKNGQLLLYVTISCINEVNLHPFSTPPQKIMHEVTKLKHNQKSLKILFFNAKNETFLLISDCSK